VASDGSLIETWFVWLAWCFDGYRCLDWRERQHFGHAGTGERIRGPLLPFACRLGCAVLRCVTINSALLPDLLLALSPGPDIGPLPAPISAALFTRPDETYFVSVR
jgi:hypothetical protein